MTLSSEAKLRQTDRIVSLLNSSFDPSGVLSVEEALPPFTSACASNPWLEYFHFPGVTEPRKWQLGGGQLLGHDLVHALEDNCQPGGDVKGTGWRDV